MAQLIKHDANAHVLTDIVLWTQDPHHTSAFLKAASARYDDGKPESPRLDAYEELVAARHRDYAGIREMMITAALSFDDVMNAIRAFEAEVNAA